MVVNGENVMTAREAAVVYLYVVSRNLSWKTENKWKVMMQTVSRHNKMKAATSVTPHLTVPRRSFLSDTQEITEARWESGKKKSDWRLKLQSPS